MLVRLPTLVLLSLALVACEPRIAVDLIDVTGVEPDRVDAGHRLSVVGQRFLLGHACTIILRGEWHRPGAPVVRRERRIEAEAISSERAEAIVGDEVLRELGGRATFRGELELRFDASSIPGGVVRGVLGGVVIDFVPAAHGALGGELAAIERDVGARFADPDGEPGVEIAEIDDGGLFAALGLAVGDRVVGRGGLRASLPTDLAIDGIPIEESVLSLTRGGVRFEVRPEPAPVAPGLDAARVLELAALLLVLGLSLGAASRRRSEPVRLAGPAHLALAVVLAGGVWRATTIGLVPDAALLAGAAGLLVVLCGALDVEGLGVAALRGLALSSAALGTAVVAGTTDLVVLAAPAADPSGWIGLATAVGPAAILAGIAAALPPASDGLPVRLLDAIALGAVAAVLTAILFGGAEPGLEGGVSFVVRSVAVAAALAIARTVLDHASRRARVVVSAVAVVLPPIGGAVAIAWPLDERASQIALESVLISLAIVLCAAIARLRPAPPLRSELER